MITPPSFEKEWEEANKEKKNHIIYDMAKWLKKFFRAITIKDSDEIYTYNGRGIYVPNGKPLIKKYTQAMLGPVTTQRIVTEIVECVKRLTYANRRIFKQEKAKNKICLQNGVLDLETLELTEHSPKYGFLMKLPVEYRKDADCPKFKQFLEEVVSNNFAVEQKNDIKALVEVLGFCLMPDYSLQKAVGLVGEGANGKSVFLQVVKALIGVENCCAVGLHELVEDKFATSRLYGKMVNIYPDLSSKFLKYTGGFKSARARATALQVWKTIKRNYNHSPAHGFHHTLL